MGLTKKEAKRLSILKWEFIIKNGGDYKLTLELPKEIHHLDANCGYCEKYKDCTKCPLFLGDTSDCADLGHPWKKWANNSTVKNAQAMLDLILKT